MPDSTDITQGQSQRQRIIELKLEHHDLDVAITRLSQDASVDQVQLVRMKKRKLQLKDAIRRLESELIPDLDA